MKNINDARITGRTPILLAVSIGQIYHNPEMAYPCVNGLAAGVEATEPFRPSRSFKV
jgi:hypothetical protein